MKKNLDKNDNMFHIDNKKLAAAFDFSTIGIRLFLTIIFILAVLCVLFATNTINFKSVEGSVYILKPSKAKTTNQPTDRTRFDRKDYATVRKN